MVFRTGVNMEFKCFLCICFYICTNAVSEFVNKIHYFRCVFVQRKCSPAGPKLGRWLRLQMYMHWCNKRNVYLQWKVTLAGSFIVPRSLASLIINIWAPSSEFVSSSIPLWQISTAHAQPFRRARDLAFCLKVPLDSLLVWASSEGSGETARMRRLAWTFAARICDKYQIRLTRSI